MPNFITAYTYPETLDLPEASAFLQILSAPFLYEFPILLGIYITPSFTAGGCGLKKNPIQL